MKCTIAWCVSLQAPPVVPPRSLSQPLASKSYVMGEISSNGAWEGRVYPAKFMIPLGMFLLSLSWLTRCIHQAIRLVDPDALEPEADPGGAGQ